MNRSSLKLAIKVLARRKVFTAISLVGIALTLAVLTVAAAVLDNITAARPPQSRLDRMLTVDRVGRYGRNISMTTNPGYGFIDRTLRDLPGVERVAVSSDLTTAMVYQGEQRYEVPLRATDADYWRVLDFRFIEGGPYSDADREGNRPVVVISERLRKLLFGAGHAVGKEINIGGITYRISGVVPEVSISQSNAYADVWQILPTPTADERKDLTGRLVAIVLARSRADIPRIKAEFAARVKRIPIDDPKTFQETRSYVETQFEAMARALTGDAAGTHATAVLLVILGFVAILFMTLPALNLITLNLSRILERAPEVGVRKAFGAPRGALVGQFVLENVVLTVIGGAIAFVLAALMLRGFEAAALIPGGHFELNLRVFGYGLLMAAFFGVFSGLYPAWKMSRLHPVSALRGGAL